MPAPPNPIPLPMSSSPIPPQSQLESSVDTSIEALKASSHQEVEIHRLKQQLREELAAQHAQELARVQRELEEEQDARKREMEVLTERIERSTKAAHYFDLDHNMALEQERLAHRHSQKALASAMERITDLESPQTKLMALGHKEESLAELRLLFSRILDHIRHTHTALPSSLHVQLDGHYLRYASLADTNPSPLLLLEDRAPSQAIATNAPSQPEAEGHKARVEKLEGLVHKKEEEFRLMAEQVDQYTDLTAGLHSTITKLRDQAKHSAQEHETRMAAMQLAVTEAESRFRDQSAELNACTEECRRLESLTTELRTTVETQTSHFRHFQTSVLEVSDTRVHSLELEIEDLHSQLRQIDQMAQTDLMGAKEAQFNRMAAELESLRQFDMRRQAQMCALIVENQTNDRRDAQASSAIAALQAEITHLASQLQKERSVVEDLESQFASPSCNSNDTSLLLCAPHTSLAETPLVWSMYRVEVGMMDDVAGREHNVVLVKHVAPAGPGAKAGLQVGDILLRFDGRLISTVEQLEAVVQYVPLGATVRVEVARQGRQMDLFMSLN
eukprot:NODE_826_length_1836_cov_24.614980_g772_i0.p1 GENE.NODE_826_length_1836_cov_24.614980_g772_i0~~NODE_826_length_1836_cov_24.614980_g772_i0.p1  ORF type:complete len:568 (-),score=155.85 NODE_826_length_1836_cov_24.614980_g772_i0:132-1811(-)